MSLPMSCTKWLVLLLALFAGCSTAAEQPAPTVSDSAGITRIEYDGTFATSSSRGWSVDSVPVFATDPSKPELHRVTTALFQSDGGVVVADGGAHQLLFFDQAGQLRARAGKKGGGPGEFHLITSVSVGPADSVFAYDGWERRVSVFDRNGTFAHAVTLRGLDTLGSVVDVGVMGHGMLVGALHRRTHGAGLVRDSLVVMAFAQSGEPALLLGVFPHTYTHWGPHRMPGSDQPVALAAPVAFSSTTALGVADTFVYVGIPEPYALVRLDRNGVRRITRQQGKPLPVTEADRDRLFGALATGRMDPQELAMLRNLEGPSTLPAFGFEPLTARFEQAMLVSDVGGVWLRPFQLPDDAVAAAWPRFDADGLYEGSVTLPPRFRATAVRGDVVLGVYRDSLDVESVRAYRVTEQR